MIEEKIRMYSDMVYRIAYSMTNRKADAEDIYQEVFMKLYNNKNNLNQTNMKKPG